MLLYPEGIVKLNQTAGEIIRRCDGVCSAAQMVAELQREFPGRRARGRRYLPILEVFRAKGWIRRQA